MYMFIQSANGNSPGSGPGSYCSRRRKDCHAWDQALTLLEGTNIPEVTHVVNKES